MRLAAPKIRSRAARTLALLVAIVAIPTACDKRKLTEVQVPDEGVTLRYDLTPGQAYGGHVKMRNSVETPMGNVVQSIEFDVEMVVVTSGDPPRLVKSTVRNVKTDLRLPEGVPAGGGFFGPEVAKAVEGMEVRFKLSETGEIDDMPEPPEDAPQELQAMVGAVSGAVAMMFVELPTEAVRADDTWDLARTEEGRTRKGKGTFKGLARDEALGEDVAKLTLSADQSAERNGQKVTTTQNTKVQFSTRGYPTLVQRTMNGEIPGLGRLTTDVTAEWKKLDVRADAVVAGGAAEEQAITDPCDPDYVGPQECAEQAITDPCDPDYVGPQECAEEPTGAADAPGDGAAKAK